MVVEIFKNACLNRPMNTSSLVADFKGHEDSVCGLWAHMGKSGRF